MRKAKIIIGLGFGDEGKGITSDFLAKQNPEAIVIRFSGGQQAAHTVMIGDKKHVHSSFASGALRGLPSYFSEHCTVHPVFLWNEREELIEKGGNIELHIHPLAKVTTPFDVWQNVNNVKNLDHGTCGKGVGATMKRNEGPYKLYAVDLIAPKQMLLEKLKKIAYYYGFLNETEIDEAMENYLEAIDKIQWNISDYSFLENYSDLIFEGSQGILLDMDHGVFPNVTYANTTSKNAFEICKKMQIDDIQVYYITRSYSTRHGNGWMSNERELKLKNNEEETCVYNEYQKELRTGDLDYDLLNYTLKLDAAYSPNAKRNLVVTCMDQLEKDYEFKKLTTEFNEIYGSFSPDSKDFKQITSLLNKRKMKYNIQNIAPESKFLFFWRHQPNKDGSISKTCFSQWWLSSFEVGGVFYKTAEHWMMAKKAELFNDKAILEKIIKANSPAEAKKLGREVKNYNDTIWLANRYEIVKEGNFHKFSQNPNLAAFLINTHSRILVEASPIDPIWGIGMASDHKDVLHPEKWKGLNLLGFALMEVRDELE